MKTAMKRLLSFVLVAMMLVSVLPFQASAVASPYVDVYAQIEGQSGHVVEKKNEQRMMPMSGDELYNYYDDIKAAGELVSVNVWWLDETAEEDRIAEGKMGDNLDPTEVIVSGGMGVKFNLKAKETKPPETPVQPTTEDWRFVVTINDTKKVDCAKKLTAGATEAQVKEAMELEVTEALKNETVAGKDIEKNIVVDTTNKTATATVTIKDKPKPEYTITFRYCSEYKCGDCTTALSDNCDNIKTKTVTTVNQELTKSMIPTDITERYGYTFVNWVNAADKNDDTPAGIYTGDATFNAVYQKGASNTHRITVYGVIYRNGETTVLSTPLAETYASNEANLLSVLNNQKEDIQKALKDMGKTASNGYEWNGNTFYNDDDLESKDVVDSADEVTKEGKYYVKVKYNGNDKVQLYVHTSKTMTIKDTITLKTYTPGETITKSKIKTAVKNAGWSYSNIKTYTLEDWEIVVKKESSAAADETPSFEVVEGETEIHVYLYNASSSGSTNKSDNPKTGDTILMAVTVMGLSATALAAAYVFMKKRAI